MSILLQILGALGVFLFGLRIMSSGLQKLAGDRLRSVLASMTRNRFTGVISGFLITCAIQSSSATTVLIVSFANAGLLTLIQSIGLVMGANIGTTLTGWLVSLFGFKVNITAFALPIIGLGFPLSFLRNPRARQLSEAMIGFGLLFLGLKFLKEGVPDLKANPEALAFLQQFSDYGFGSVLLFVGVGTALTIIVQSSSATMAITLTMAAMGWINYEVSAAMVLGENIGTTITANIAALGGNRTAKRVALSHTVFNLTGVLWMLPLMSVFLTAVDAVVPGNPLTDPLATPTHLAAFHSAFNVTNTLLLVGFVPVIERIVLRLVPLRPEEAHVSQLAFLETGLAATPELALVEAQRGVQRMAETSQTTFHEVRLALLDRSADAADFVDVVGEGEESSDQMEREITAFCTELARSGTSLRVGEAIREILEIADDQESFCDTCYKIVLQAQRVVDDHARFGAPGRKLLTALCELLEENLELVVRALDQAPPKDLAERANELYEELVLQASDGRKQTIAAMQDKSLSIADGILLLDIITSLRKLARFCAGSVERAVRVQPQ